VFDEDSTALKNLYDLFGDSDGAGDAKDAMLSLVEFASNVTIPKLQEALLPIGKLDLTRIDPSFDGDPASVPIAKLFNMLDTDGTSHRMIWARFVRCMPCPPQCRRHFVL